MVHTRLAAPPPAAQELVRWRQEKAEEYLRMGRSFAQVNALYDERCAQVRFGHQGQVGPVLVFGRGSGFVQCALPGLALAAAGAVMIGPREARVGQEWRGRAGAGVLLRAMLGGGCGRRWQVHHAGVHALSEGARHRRSWCAGAVAHGGDAHDCLLPRGAAGVEGGGRGLWGGAAAGEAAAAAARLTGVLAPAEALSGGRLWVYMVGFAFPRAVLPLV